MWKRIFVQSLRHLRRNGAYTFINTLGLSLGLSVALIVYQYVTAEQSYDAFHEHRDHIFRVTTEWNRDRTPNDRRATTIAWSGPGVKDAFPEVLEYARFAPLDVFTGANVVSFEEKIFKENRIYLADPGFLRMFSFRMVSGNPETALDDPASIVITESVAKKYFPDGNAIGKFLLIDDHDNISENPTDLYQVTGVVTDPPLNSHIRFDFLLPFSIIYRGLHSGSTYWHWDYTYCYLLLHPRADVSDLERKMSAQRLKEFGHEMIYYSDDIDFRLQPLLDIHLKSDLRAELSPNSDYRIIILVLICGICILVTAYANYAILNTLKGIERQTEIGIRKVMGSSRWMLIGQIVAESFLLNFISLGLAAIIFLIAHPFLSEYLGHSLNDGLFSFRLILICFILLLSGTFFTSAYPAIRLSAFLPVYVLKRTAGQRRTGNGVNFRNVTVVVQLSLCFVACVIGWVMNRQLQFMDRHDKGMNPEHILIVRGYGFQSASLFEHFRSSLLVHPFIKATGTASSSPGEEINELNFNPDISRMDEPFRKSRVKMMFADAGFFSALGIHFLAGEPPSDEIGIKDQVVINETAAKVLGYSNPFDALDQPLQGFYDHPVTIKGVVRNFNQRSLKHDFEPMVFVPMKGNEFGWNKRYFFIKLSPVDYVGQMKDRIEIIARSWEVTTKSMPFDYFFLETFYKDQYRADQRLNEIFSSTSGFMILISLLGIFIVMSYSTVRRTKEIGIRKVFGASIESIVLLLSSGILRLMLFSLLITIPLAIVLVRQWVNDYAFSIEVDVPVIVVPVLFVAAMALIPVSLQAGRAACQNPTKSLRDE